MPNRTDVDVDVRGIVSQVKYPAIAFFAIIGLWLFIHLFMFTVPAGNVAVLATGGSVGDQVYGPGPHLSMPWQHSIVYPTRTVAEARDSIPFDSNNQPLTATVVPQIWIEPSAVPALVKNIGPMEALLKMVIDQQVQQATRANTPRHTPEELIWNRPDLVKAIQDELNVNIAAQLKAKGVPENAVHVGYVAMTQFGFSPSVIDTLETKAEQTVKNRTATAAAKITEIRADASAKEKEITSAGDADYAQTIAAANAYAVTKKGEALKAATDIATYEALQKWKAAGGHMPEMQLGNGAQVILNPSTVASPAAPR